MACRKQRPHSKLTSPPFQVNNAFLIHFGYVIVVYAAQENSSGRLTPYCLALQWHDYMFFVFITIIW